MKADTVGEPARVVLSRKYPLIRSSGVEVEMDSVPNIRNAVVSFDNEPLILVDEDDREIGYLPKSEAHLGAGRLHRAFSLFVFDERGRLLMQRRAATKRLWPDYWSNTCCSHPRRGEDINSAVHRRLHEELRLSCPLEFLFKFQYQAQFDAAGAENELCWVYSGCSNTVPDFNQNEISDVRYIEPAELDLEMKRHPRDFTPWFKLEWARIRRGIARTA
ncbi:MAG: isopentenyl-diphosphate Delta-isomerase [Dokdonella sp.]|uniref:isopentenyl-diphosphate Delta-isomerase n=1 Tax=Dokdonella sp. TaxID=2291710 RepID=UPI003267B4D1